MPTNTSRSAWFIRLGLGILILSILLWWQGKSILGTFSAVPWWTILAAVVSYWILQLICAWKWQLLINAALREENSPSPPLTLVACARYYLAGMFWNLWMPSSIGGDAVRAYLAGKKCGRLSLAASAVLADRLSGLVALLVIGTISVVIERLNGVSQEGSALLQSQHLLWIAAFLLCVGTGIWFGMRMWSTRLVASEKKLLSTLARKMESLHRNISLYRQPGVRYILLISFVLSLLFQIGVIALNIGLAFAVQLPLNLLVYWWLIPALALASLIPVGIGGLGVREAAAVAMVGTLTVAAGGNTSNLIAWSLLWQATLWLAGLPGAWSTRIK